MFCVGENVIAVNDIVAINKCFVAGTKLKITGCCKVDNEWTYIVKDKNGEKIFSVPADDLKHDKYSSIYDQLDNLINEAPCKGGPCVGSQNCEYGVYGCYRDVCAIETVQAGADYYKRKEEQK